MKTALPILLIASFFVLQNNQAQTGNVGIGTSLPRARLHVADSSVLFSSNITAFPFGFTPPAMQGKGIRMMWYPQKGAFRVGAIDDGPLIGDEANVYPITGWDKDSIGLLSFAAGLNTKAKGDYSSALGFVTSANGFGATSMGILSVASGQGSLSAGYLTVASGYQSTAMGFDTKATGQFSFATGRLTVASAYTSMAMGTQTIANGNFSTAIGNYINNNSWTGSFAIGDYNSGSTLGNTKPNQMMMRFSGGYRFHLDDGTPAMVIESNNGGKVGIGTASPTFPLSFNTDIGDKISLWSVSPVSYGFGIQSSLLQIHTDVAGSDIAFGYGSSASFNETMRIKGNGNLGIGTSNPNAPLGFPPYLGKKITLYPGATGDVGMAVQGNLLQIYSDNPNADIAFGYDQAGTLTERMRITGSGNVGIGMYPFYPLDINGRMRLSGTNPNDPGIWLNDASVDRAFIGLENNNYVGFYGNQGAGWKFAMNTTTGALKVNGSEGSAGQVLMSSGFGGTTNWTDLPAKPYAFTIVPTQFTSLSGGFLVQDIGGVNNSLFTINSPSTVLYTLTLQCESPSNATVDSKGFVVVEILPNGSSTRVSYATCAYYIRQATKVTQIATGVAMNLPAGNYVIKARLVRLSIIDGELSAHGSFNANEQGTQFIAQVIPN